ncbi:ethanolamine utilization protein EutJ [Limosilactobacillus reuteri]|uniref:Ethanolamine utilization protein EutJ n=1 Tax=Limosilactobacillus reuteri TaxID=1598 RepID=A0A317GJP1_LIMRT|nr:ethanolamine utilization protein EutJ [Limosilactobacillus reuteri]PWT48925.1 ethanolamine utilization protein EutJ [Limosilactobacillus reuteri]PWT53561.1 ethanolamine utilization protein EutJ [Limosilactobacillus reuteri]PWT64089.1 ethanolamine utilization protein EutJ [Limosilactobacillus reuteri]
MVNGDKPLRKVTADEKLKVGVDLGTSSIVLTVLDSKDKIVYGAYEYDHAVQDGIVVNFIESVNILRRLKEKAEKVLGRELKTACGAVPPKTGEKSAKVVANVIEETGMLCTGVEDEPTAAAKFLRLSNGTVVDIGGGTTGISIFKDNKLIHVIDEATGGFHMTLVLGGRYKIKNDEAEKLKRNKDKESEVYAVVKPVVEKMAAIVQNMGVEIIDPVIVVGGATNFTEFTTTFSKDLKRKVYKPLYPQFVTPLGIAMFDD